MNDIINEEDLTVGLIIRRSINNRKCLILKLDKDKRKALVKTGSYATWINYLTIFNEWRRFVPIVAPKIICEN